MGQSTQPPPSSSSAPDSATATASTTHTPRSWAVVQQQAEHDPLSHPLVASMGLETMDFEYRPPHHLIEIYNAVYQALNPDRPRAPKNLCRIMPREHGKSEAGTIVVPVWAALADPNVRILIMSETQEQANGKLRECRDHLEALAPQFDHEVTEDNKQSLTLARSATWDVPTIKAAGFNTGVTGGHYDIVIFDDCVSWETQRTGGRREKRWQQFQDYLNLGSEGDSLFLVLGTRKHPEDLYNNLINGPAWDSIVLPAISDWSVVEQNEFDVITDADSRFNATAIGEIPADETIVATDPYRSVRTLWPERWPLDTLLLDLIAGYGSERGQWIWRRENQNIADALQGQILSADMLTIEDRLSTHPSQMSWYAGLDPAIESDPDRAVRNDTDYWSLSVIGYDRSNDITNLVDTRRRRGMTMSQGLRWTESILSEFDLISKVLVEDVQAQRWFVQEGTDLGLPLEQSKSSGAKRDRIIQMASRFESGKIRLLSESASPPLISTVESWDPFINEWVGFPSSRHDDMLDSTEIALRALDETAPEMYHFGYN